MRGLFVLVALACLCVATSAAKAPKAAKLTVIPPVPVPVPEPVPVEEEDSDDDEPELEPILIHVIYAQYFSPENRDLSDNRSLKLTAPTLTDALRAVVSPNHSGHEIIALLMSAATDYTIMPTEENIDETTYVEIDTYIFTFTEEAAANLARYAIARPPEPETIQKSARSPSRQQKKTHSRRLETPLGNAEEVIGENPQLYQYEL